MASQVLDRQGDGVNDASPVVLEPELLVGVVVSLAIEQEAAHVFVEDRLRWGQVDVRLLPPDDCVENVGVELREKARIRDRLDEVNEGEARLVGVFGVLHLDLVQ